MCICLAAMSIYEADTVGLSESLLKSSRVLLGPYDEYLIPPKLMLTIVSSVVIPVLVGFLISPSARYEAHVRLNEVTKSMFFCSKKQIWRNVIFRIYKDSAIALRLLIKVILNDDATSNKIDIRHAAQLRQSYSRLMTEIESHLLFARYEVFQSKSLRHDKVIELI